MKTKPNPKPAGWMTHESWHRLRCGGNDSRGTVPIHKKPSKSACIPLYFAAPGRP